MPPPLFPPPPRASLRSRRPSFQIDDRINIAIDYDLAVELGQLIYDAKSDNTALVALGNQLLNLEKD